MSRATNSVGQIGSTLEWTRENLQFLRMRLEGMRSKEQALEAVLAEIDGYRDLYQRITGRTFRDAHIFEIGYGARPLRLISLISLSHDARGIDLDAPMLQHSATDLRRILRTNGLARFLKSSVRSLVFDGHERRALARVLARRGSRYRIERDRFLVGDVAQAALPEASVDFFYSEDVFEHIPRESLPGVCSAMACALAHDGIAVVSPAVFTGVSGGHLVEWYPHTFDSQVSRRSEPWEHLRQRRFVADCFLNQLRVRDYHELFATHFEIVSVESLHAGRGRQFLTPAIRAELAAYDEHELLSDKWRFVLRKRRPT